MFSTTLNIVRSFCNSEPYNPIIEKKQNKKKTKGRLTYPILDSGRVNRSLILSILGILLNLVILFSSRYIQRLNETKLFPSCISKEE